MSFHPVPKREFMPSLERCEPLIPDHSSTKVFRRCPREYFYSMVCGYQPTGTVTVLIWGTAYHKFREVLEKEQNLELAVLHGMNIWDEQQGRDPLPDTTWGFMTKARLLKSFLVAYKHWQNEKEKKAVEVIAVEAAFNIELPDGSRTSGRADQIVRWNRRLWGRDFKTSSVEQQFYTRTLSPNDQFSRYTYAESQLCGEPIQGQIVEVLFNKADHKTSRGKSPTGPEIITHIATRTPSEIRQWVLEAQIENKLIDLCRDNDVWPQNENACRYCAYHQVCKTGEEDSMVQILRSSDYTRRPWVNTDV
jgi:PD-(D/E)XK nuclease superfamily